MVFSRHRPKATPVILTTDEERISDTAQVRTNYEPQSDAATGRMLASATGMAAATVPSQKGGWSEFIKDFGMGLCHRLRREPASDTATIARII